MWFYWQYGGEEHLNAPPKDLLLAQTVSYTDCTNYLFRFYCLKGQR